jgi:hypothetical protein
MLLLATSNGVGVNVRLVGSCLSISGYQQIYTSCQHLSCCPCHTAYSTHDVISQIPELTSLQGLHHKTSNHLLTGRPLNAHFLHVHPICDNCQMMISLVRLPFEALPFCSSVIELLLSCYNKLSMIPHPCANRKQ